MVEGLYCFYFRGVPCRITERDKLVQLEFGHGRKPFNGGGSFFASDYY